MDLNQTLSLVHILLVGVPLVIAAIASIVHMNFTISRLQADIMTLKAENKEIMALVTHKNDKIQEDIADIKKDLSNMAESQAEIKKFINLLIDGKINLGK
jgi:cell division protein FtsB